MHKSALPLVACLLALVAAGAGAQTVYKWRDANGEMHISDSPPPTGTTNVTQSGMPGVGRMPVETTQGMWGPLVVATPETVAVDLFRESPCGLDRAALTLAELRTPLKRRKLALALEAAGDVPAAQRLGYALEWLGFSRQADTVSGWLAGHRPRIVKLSPGACADAAPVHPRWRVKGEMPAGLLSA